VRGRHIKTLQWGVGVQSAGVCGYRRRRIGGSCGWPGIEGLIVVVVLVTWRALHEFTRWADVTCVLSTGPKSLPSF